MFMNTNDIEKLLRKAPRPVAPAGLMHELQADLRISPTTHREIRESSFGLRRWIPALGFAAWFLGCVIVLGVQTARITELKERARAIEAAAADVQKEQSTIATQTSAAIAELEQLRKDLADVTRLRAEVDQLRVDLAQLPALQAENARLRGALSARTSATQRPEDDFFASQKGRAERLVCVNHLKQFCLAARIWANESKTDALPKDVESLKPYLNGMDKMLFCPSDGTTPYQILSPGASESHPQVVFVRCPIHNNVGMVDGSVQQLSPEHKLVQRNGEYEITR
jgi:hypothetical protein